MKCPICHVDATFLKEQDCSDDDEDDTYYTPSWAMCAKEWQCPHCDAYLCTPLDEYTDENCALTDKIYLVDNVTQLAFVCNTWQTHEQDWHFLASRHDNFGVLYQLYQHLQPPATRGGGAEAWWEHCFKEVRQQNRFRLAYYYGDDKEIGAYEGEPEAFEFLPPKTVEESA